MSRYDNMKFPAYRYEEYPKWVRLGSGAEKLVNSKREEIAFIATDTDAPDVANDPVIQEKIRLAEQNAAQSAQIAALQDQLVALQEAMTKSTANAKADATAKADANTNAASTAPAKS